VIVLTVPERIGMATALCADAARHGHAARLVLDGDAVEHGPDHWRGYRRCLEGDEAALVLEDDAEPEPGMWSALHPLAAMRRLVCLYNTRAAIAEGARPGTLVPWATATTSLALLWPQGWRPQFLWYGDRDFPWDDGDWRLTEWLRFHRLRCWYTYPSLAQHGRPTGSTLPGHNNSTRFSRWTVRKLGMGLAPQRWEAA
jgi:hypothetical protein